MEKMKGKVCIVTGGNSGIGKETALALAGMGATVVMAVRNRERGEKALAEIVAKTGNKNVFLMICDMSSFESIRLFAREFRAKYKRLDVLVNNAGAFVYKRQTTADGYERTFAVNYLGPVLLTHELLPLLKSSAPSRIINISSGIYRAGKLDFGNLQGEGKYRSMRKYSNAKLMLMMYTYELARRLEGSGVTANVVVPGFVRTDLGKNSGSRLYSLSYKIMSPFQISAKKSAETPVHLASSAEVAGVTGKCFAKCREKATFQLSNDLKNQKLLWEATAELLGFDPTR